LGAAYRTVGAEILVCPALHKHADGQRERLMEFIEPPPAGFLVNRAEVERNARNSSSLVPRPPIKPRPVVAPAPGATAGRGFISASTSRHAALSCAMARCLSPAIDRRRSDQELSPNWRYGVAWGCPADRPPGRRQALPAERPRPTTAALAAQNPSWPPTPTVSAGRWWSRRKSAWPTPQSQVVRRDEDQPPFLHLPSPFGRGARVLFSPLALWERGRG